MNFNKLKRNLKKDVSEFRSAKIALLGDSATQLLGIALKGYGIERNINIELFESEYDSIYETIINKESRLYQNSFDYIIVFQCSHKLRESFYDLPIDKRPTFGADLTSYIKNLYNNLSQNSSAKIIITNYYEVLDGVFGNYACKTNHSFLYQLRLINFNLQNLALDNKDLFIADIASIVNHAGVQNAISDKWYVTTSNVFTLDFLPSVAKVFVDIVTVLIGKFKKCLIVDLDNTMWGGVIGDDGINNIQLGELGIGKAFTQLQKWIKELRQRGIIIAVCSKNEESIAKEVFTNHPDMILRLEDISIFVANWSNKGDNIKYIQQVLNIGMDSLVFIDDNPFERDLVRAMIPEVVVPELPKDPAEYLPYLMHLNLFETISFTKEDLVRTKKYQDESQRIELKRSFDSLNDYLVSLDMTATVEGLNSFNLARCAQLTQRSNQFNLTTIRYTEEELVQFTEEGGKILCIRLFDKFGDYGIISLAMIVKKEVTAEINTWIMSCRVLKRGVEEFVLNKIVEASKEMNCNQLVGRYIATPKNKMASGLFADFNFTKLNESDYVLDLNNFEPLLTNITQRDEQKGSS